MTELMIDRFTTNVQMQDGGDEASASVRGLAGRVADVRLERAAATVDLPPGDWCVRRVNVPLVLDLTRPEIALEEEWAQAVMDAIEAAIDQPTAEVVHYPRSGDALIDMVVSTARRSAEREWAWRQLGVVTPEEASPVTDPRAAVLHALRRSPRETVGALIAAVGEVGVAAMHRLLGSDGWTEVAAIACAAVGYPVPARTVVASPDGSRPWAGVPPTQPSALPSIDPARPAIEHASDGLVQATTHLAGHAVARSALASAFASSPIHPDAVSVWNWSVLVAVEFEPSIIARANGTDVIEAIAEHIDGRTSMTTHAVGLRASATPSQRPERRASLGEDGSRGIDTADESVIPADRSLQTDWAGLLFLLNTAADACIPSTLLDDAVLAGRSLTEVLSAIALRVVPTVAGDPAVLGFSGQLTNNPARFTDFTNPEAESVAQHADRWVAATVARIDDPTSEPDEVLRRIVSRSGIIDADPGWTEVRLDLADVDVDVRIGGLDVDPGWLPWLGTAVRFSYV